MRIISFNCQSASAEGFEPMVEQLSEETAWDAIALQEVSFPWENWVADKRGLVRHGHYLITNAAKQFDTAILLSRQWITRILRQSCCRWCVGVCLQSDQGKNRPHIDTFANAISAH
jgi:exonuclease III